jgi:hypothetical protein
MHGVVFVELIDTIEHVVALIASLLVAVILEPTLPGVILRFSLVHSVPPVQVSNVVPCRGCFSVARGPGGLAIVSEVGIGPVIRVTILSATIFVVIFIVVDRHFDNLGLSARWFCRIVSCCLMKGMTHSCYSSSLCRFGNFLEVLCFSLFSEAVASTMSIAVIDWSS